MTFEPLGMRITPAVNAFFSASSGVLSVIGDGLDNTIEVSRDASGRHQPDQDDNKPSRTHYGP